MSEVCGAQALSTAMHLGQPLCHKCDGELRAGRRLLGWGVIFHPPRDCSASVVGAGRGARVTAGAICTPHRCGGRPALPSIRVRMVPSQAKAALCHTRSTRLVGRPECQTMERRSHMIRGLQICKRHRSYHRWWSGLEVRRTEGQKGSEASQKIARRSTKYTAGRLERIQCDRAMS